LPEIRKRKRDEEEAAKTTDQDHQKDASLTTGGPSEDVTADTTEVHEPGTGSPAKKLHIETAPGKSLPDDGSRGVNRFEITIEE